MSKKSAKSANRSDAEAVPHLAEFGRALSSASREEIASDLLLSLSDRSGTIQFAPDQPAERQLFHLFNTLNPTAGEQLKAGTTRALAEWSASVHGYHTLRSLAFLAAYIRALSAGPTIKSIVLQQLSGGAADGPRIRASLDLLRVMLGFSPDREHSEVFAEILFADRSPEAFWGLCFVGASKHDMANFRLYATRYIDLLAFNTEQEFYPNPEPAIHRLVEQVTFRRLADALPQLRGRHLERMMRLLCTGPSPPARYDWDPRSGEAYLVDIRPYVSTKGTRHLLPKLSDDFLESMRYVDSMIVSINEAGAVADAKAAMRERPLLMRSK